MVSLKQLKSHRVSIRSPDHSGEKEIGRQDVKESDNCFNPLPGSLRGERLIAGRPPACYLCFNPLPGSLRGERQFVCSCRSALSVSIRSPDHSGEKDRSAGVSLFFISFNPLPGSLRGESSFRRSIVGQVPTSFNPLPGSLRGESARFVSVTRPLKEFQSAPRITPGRKPEVTPCRMP